MSSTSPPWFYQPSKPQRTQAAMTPDASQGGKTSSCPEMNSKDFQRMQIAREINALYKDCKGLMKIYDAKAPAPENNSHYRDQTFDQIEEHLDALDYYVHKAIEGYEKRLAEAGNSESVLAKKTDPVGCPGLCHSGWDACYGKLLDSLDAQIAEKDREINRLKKNTRFSGTHHYHCIHIPENHGVSSRYARVQVSNYYYTRDGNSRLTNLEKKGSELQGLKQRVTNVETEIDRLGENRIDEKKEVDSSDQTKVSWVEVVENQKAKKVKCRLRRWLHI
ncbi:uncharacterized protein N7483_004365 [Penicillium malachiteum]|uniref:uncharacterized protein n=1 Tax=Penicillium malachiteum TaxID=1324776 RepID=UPI0025486C99|nr:uncharacterized protein N7483_004365 [Penicillium malachiteum]KAJ5729857.1 hypothetical protein N7483_004365 [Penicillium malachiteum]